MKKKQAKEKVFIVADMEGISGVLSWKECSPKSDEYQHYREIMTLEVNAAVEGCLDYGVKDITVRDSHCKGDNIIPSLLNPKAELLRGFSGSSDDMLDGIDASYTKCMFIGAHSHDSSTSGLGHILCDEIEDLYVNGDNYNETMWNVLIAASYDVPTIFVSGDDAAVRMCESHYMARNGIIYVITKLVRGQSVITYSQDTNYDNIYNGVKDSLDKKTSPIVLPKQYDVQLNLKNQYWVNRMCCFPSVKALPERKGNCVQLVADDFDVVKDFISFISIK